MFVLCCLPYLARKEVLISNKAKVIHSGKDSLLCTLKQNKNTSGTLDHVYLDYQFYCKNTEITEHVGHCYASRMTRYTADVFINIAPLPGVDVTKVKLSLGWKYRLSPNEIRFKVTTDDQPTTNPLWPTKLDLGCGDCPIGKLPSSPAESQSSNYSDFFLSFSEYEPKSKHESASYYLSHPQASAKHSSVGVTSRHFNGVMEAGKPVYFKVVVRNNEGEPLPKGTKFQLCVKLRNETIFTGSAYKTTFKIKRIHSGQFTPLFFINEDLLLGNHFYVNVVPSSPHSIQSIVFQVESPPKCLTEQEINDVLFQNIWTRCNADIVDRYGNKVIKSYDVEITADSFEFSQVDLDEGTLHFSVKANEIGKAKISFKLRKEYSDTNIVLTTDVCVK